jgi:hypothetical protein
MSFFTATQATTQVAQTVPNLTGGTNGKVVRISSTNTCTNASNTDTPAQLNSLLVKMGDVYYSSGFINGFTGLTAGLPYFLSTGGDITASPPSPSASARVVFIGFAVNTTSLIFKPGTPITGV